MKTEKEWRKELTSHQFIFEEGICKVQLDAVEWAAEIALNSEKNGKSAYQAILTAAQQLKEHRNE